MRSISCSCAISEANTSTPPTAMLTGPCSAASEDRSAGESSSATAGRTLLVRARLRRGKVARVSPRASLLVVLALCLAAPAHALAHAVLVQSNPESGATLGTAPANVSLGFTEQPEAALSTIEVVSSGGTTYQLGRPSPDGSLGLAVRLRPLPDGVYTVRYRVL